MWRQVELLLKTFSKVKKKRLSTILADNHTIKSLQQMKGDDAQLRNYNATLHDVNESHLPVLIVVSVRSTFNEMSLCSYLFTMTN